MQEAEIDHYMVSYNALSEAPSSSHIGHHLMYPFDFFSMPQRPHFSSTYHSLIFLTVPQLLYLEDFPAVTLSYVHGPDTPVFYQVSVS